MVQDCIILHTLYATLHTPYSTPNTALQGSAIYLHFPLLFNFFHRIAHCTVYTPSPSVFNDFPWFSFVFFLLFSWHSSMFLHCPPFPPCFQWFSFVFFLTFSCHSSISVVLFLPFSWHSIFPQFSMIFLRFYPTFFLSFLYFPPFSTRFQPFSFLFCRFFPTFFLAFLHVPPFSLCFQRFSFVFFLLFPVIPPFSSIFHLFSTIFLHFRSFFSYLFPGIPPFSPCFQRFSFVFFLPFSCTIFLNFPWFVNGPRGNRSLPSPLCVVVHAPQKSSICPPSTATNFEIFVPYATTTPQTP